MTDIELRFEGFQAYDVEPMAVPDLFARRPVVVFGKYKGQPQGRITVVGRTAAGEFSKSLDLAQASVSSDNSALRLLWARHRIRRLDDLNRLVGNSERAKEVTTWAWNIV